MHSTDTNYTNHYKLFAAEFPVAFYPMTACSLAHNFASTERDTDGAIFDVEYRDHYGLFNGATYFSGEATSMFTTAGAYEALDTRYISNHKLGLSVNIILS